MQGYERIRSIFSSVIAHDEGEHTNVRETVRFNQQLAEYIWEGDAKYYVCGCVCSVFLCTVQACPVSYSVDMFTEFQQVTVHQLYKNWEDDLTSVLNRDIEEFLSTMEMLSCELVIF